MNPSLRRTLPLVLTTLGLLLAGGCTRDEAVHIRYEQIGACNGFRHAAGTSAAGPNAAYAIFKITAVTNTGKDARDFVFEPDRLFVNLSPRVQASTRLQLAQLNPFSVFSMTVAKGTTATPNGSVFAVVPTADADGAKEAAQTSYFLLYDTPSGGQPVFVDKTNVNQTNWAYTPDCTSVRF